MADVIYKFLSVEHAFRIMEQHELKVSLIRDLNDVYDCEWFFGPAADESGYINPAVAKAMFASVRDIYGVLCFSKSYRSPLLWGHYAEQAKGLALGFDPTQFAFPNKMDVEYRKDRPVVKWPADIALVESQYEQLMKEHFGVKAWDWRYEKEVRYVVDLGRCMPRTRMYFSKFNPCALREVVVGPRSSVTCAYLQHFLASHYKEIGVSLYTTTMDPKKYKIVGKLFPPSQLFDS